MNTPIPPTRVTTLAPTESPVSTATVVKRLHEWADLKTGKGPVYSQAWSPDGRWLVTADYDQIKVWDIQSRREAGVLAGHTSFVWGLAWSPDGSVLASASQDGSVRLWDVSTYSETATLKTGWAFCVAWFPDGSRLVVGNETGQVQIWDMATKQLLDTWQTATRSPIISIAWSPDGKTIASGELGGEIYLWDVETGQVHTSLTGYTTNRCDVNGLAWSPDGRTLASAHQDGQVRLWDVKTGQLLRTIEAHTGWARGVAWSPSGQLLASTGEDKRICLWNPETGQEYAEEHHNSLPVWSVSWSPDGTHVASGAGAYQQKHVGATIVWTVPTPTITPSPVSPTPTNSAESAPLVPITLANAKDVRLLKTLPIPDFSVSSLSQCSVAFSPDGKLLSGVCYKSTAPVWDVATGQLLYSLAKSPVQAVAVAFSPDSKTIIVGDYSGKIGLYDAATGESVKTFNPLSSAVWELDFNPAGDQFASASFYTGMHLWNASSEDPVWNYGEKDRLRVLSVNYHPNGETIAFGTLAKGVILLDAKTGQLIKNLPIAVPVGDVAFSPDGQWLAAGSDDNKIRMWRTSDYELEKTLEGNTHYVNGVTFSPDGRWLVSGSHDKTVGIWDVQSGQLLKSLDGHKKEVLRVAVDPTGTQIASISWDGTVRLWGIEADRVETQAEAVSLTTEDNVTLSATLFGQGQLAVILAHQGTEGTDQTSWQPFARLLAEHGYAALTLDFRGRGQSKGYLQASQLIKDVNAAMQFLQERGYQRIVCMGASMGGTACLRAALDHDLAGLVVIASPLSSGAPTAVTPAELSKLTLPKLYVCTENDRYSFVISQTQQMFDLSSDPKQLKFFPGRVHGTELFDTEYGDEFRQLLSDFVEQLP